jgi:stage II sporulation protein AA (anti-sigma F factor antagonist)
MHDGTLRASVAAGVSGPVVILSGEADLTSAGQLSALITAQLSGGTRQLTVDVSGLRFADTAAIRTLVLAARTLKERGGSLVLLRPQQTMARVLDLLGRGADVHDPGGGPRRARIRGQGRITMSVPSTWN